MGFGSWVLRHVGWLRILGFAHKGSGLRCDKLCPLKEDGATGTTRLEEQSGV